ncbi:hypothetical protein TNCT_32601 [Trichonephila clavata]|uniref:Uncharacterized protein n=1 Tax=Trichonephila clavata TaxID=2740835 RepID=A0A8X6LL10_TRICU|nr:hypothetical protein TNCT_32601 [Trichonephila clavata]
MEGFRNRTLYRDHSSQPRLGWSSPEPSSVVCGGWHNQTSFTWGTDIHWLAGKFRTRNLSAGLIRSHLCAYGRLRVHPSGRLTYGGGGIIRSTGAAPLNRQRKFKLGLYPPAGLPIPHTMRDLRSFLRKRRQLAVG